MKFLFICGSLEPGRDGVGDYSRRLATELIINGHEAKILSLNDRFIKEKSANGSPYSLSTEPSNGSLELLRLSHETKWTKRVRILHQQTDAWGPDWISLQYVPYAYHDKGFPFRLANSVKAISGRNRNIHIMFHELWIGRSERWNLLRMCTAGLQKTFTLKTGKIAQCIHTHLPEYMKKLQRAGLQPKNLAVVSSIPLVEHPVSDLANARTTFRIAFFSVFSMPSALIEWLRMLSQDCGREGLHIEFHFCGKIPRKSQVLWEVALKPFGEPIFHGWLDDKTLSHVLSTCQAGATGYPQHALGKSGSVAAFIEHNLPIIAPYKSRNDSPPFFDKALVNSVVKEPTLEEIAKASHWSQKARSVISIQSVVQKFLSDLQ